MSFQAATVVAASGTASVDPLRVEIARIATGETKLFSLSKLAKEAGITRSHLSNYLSGKRELSAERKKDVASAVKRMAVTHGDILGARSHYLKLLTDLVHGFDLRVLLSGTRADELGYVPIDKFFVEPTYRALRPGLNSTRDSCLKGIDSLTKQNSFLHILGTAGSGKTTAIRYQILRLSEQKNDRMPIFLPLNALNRYLPPPQSPFSPLTDVDTQAGASQARVDNLFEAICAWTKATFQHDFTELFKEALGAGQAFVMLDGLDEVHPSNNHAAVTLINQFIKNLQGSRGDSQNQVLITQRGHQPFPPHVVFEGSTVFEILEFNPDQIELLVDKWLGVFGDVISHDPSLLNVMDIADWQSLLEKLRKAWKRSPSSPGKRIMGMMPTSLRKQILESSDRDGMILLDYHKFVTALNGILKQRDFYHPKWFEGTRISEETNLFLRRSGSSLSEKEIERRNRLLLEDSYEQEIGRSRMRRSLDNVSMFKEALLRSPLDTLTTNPFFLTLITAIFLSRGIEEVFVQPAKAAVLNSYYKAVLGVWNNVRSLDGFPTPLRDRFPRGLSQTMLSHLAWEMIDHGKNIKSTSIPLHRAEAVVGKIYDQYNFGAAAPMADDPRVKEEAQAFANISKDAGILSQDQFGDVTFFHEIVRDWFLTGQMRSHPVLLQEHVKAHIAAPSPARVEWRDPIALSLSAMGSVDENMEGLAANVLFALDSFPLNSEQLNAVLPLGLELCLELLENGGSYPGLELQILRKLRDFFEDTEYAVLTDALHPRIIRLLPRADWGRTIPRDTISLRNWLQGIETDDDDNEWTAQVDRVWRYQTDIDCFDMLFKAVDERLKDGEKHEKLYRRLVFGLRFAKCDPQLKVNRLHDVIKRPALNPVIRSMALYALKNIYHHLRSEKGETQGVLEKIRHILREANGSKLQQIRVGEISVTSVQQLVESLTPYHIEILVDQAKTRILEDFQTATDLTGEKIIDDLVEIVNGDDSPKKSGEVNRKRVIAIVLLVSIFENEIFGKSYEDIYPAHFANDYTRAGANDGVLSALLNAAQVSEEKQHENVDACQVYDFAAWGIRRIFIHASDLSSLPLPPVGDLDVSDSDL
jgi:transcriptional regulator with XRE-family HTH domain